MTSTTDYAKAVKDLIAEGITKVEAITSMMAARKATQLKASGHVLSDEDMTLIVRSCRWAAERYS